MKNYKLIEPKVGMLGTYCIGTDRYAVVICKVNSSKSIFIQFLYDYKTSIEIPKYMIDGIEYWKGDAVKLCIDNAPSIDGTIDFIYENAEFWSEGTFTLRKNNKWVNKGKPMNSPGNLILGKADPYIDPDF